jgi:hypothetical protein
MEDRCEDIRPIRELEECAIRLAKLDGSDPAGLYYQAIACCHLGKTRQGMKAIERALRMEPDAGDMMVLKAQLLVQLQRHRLVEPHHAR